MKRSLIAVAALLLLLSGTTFASPPRAPRFRFSWGPVLAWFHFGHHHESARWERRENCRPPAYVPEHRYDRGRHYGWQRGRHYGWYRGRHDGWDRNEPPRGRGGEPREREHGRGGGRGRG